MCHTTNHLCTRRAALRRVQDFVREKREYQHLRSFTLKEFVGLLFERCPGLEAFKPSLEEIYQNFNQYKRAVPVRSVGGRAWRLQGGAGANAARGRVEARQVLDRRRQHAAQPHVVPSALHRRPAGAPSCWIRAWRSACW